MGSDAPATTLASEYQLYVRFQKPVWYIMDGMAPKDAAEVLARARLAGLGLQGQARQGHAGPGQAALGRIEGHGGPDNFHLEVCQAKENGQR